MSQSALSKAVAIASADLSAAGTFFSAVGSYFISNVKPELVKATGLAMQAAEDELGNDADGNAKYELALEKAGAAAASEGWEFVKSDFNFALEAFVQKRNELLAVSASEGNDSGASAADSQPVAEDASVKPAPEAA